MMQVIGIHGKSGAGKTTVAGFLAAELADLGYTSKIDSMILIARQRARFNCTATTKKSARGWIQNFVANIREGSLHYFINDLFVRNNMDSGMWEPFSDQWEPADFLIIHDVRRPEEVEFCRRHGVVVHVQGTRQPLAGPEAEHETELAVEDLFCGADHIITQQPSLDFLCAAVRAMVRAAGI